MLSILGGGGHGCVVADLAQSLEIVVSSVYDDNSECSLVSAECKWGGELNKVISCDGAIALGVGDNKLRQQIFSLLKEYRAKILTLIHPTATVSNTASLGRGTVVLKQAVVGPAARFGEACIINTAVIAEHHVVVGDGCHIAPGAILLGGCTIGEGTLVGAGTIVLPGVTIGANCIIGAGSVVAESVDSYTKFKNPRKKVFVLEGND